MLRKECLSRRSLGGVTSVITDHHQCGITAWKNPVAYRTMFPRMPWGRLLFPRPVGQCAVASLRSLSGGGPAARAVLEGFRVYVMRRWRWLVSLVASPPGLALCLSPGFSLSIGAKWEYSRVFSQNSSRILVGRQIML